MNWCPNCYKAYDEGEKICKSCGTTLTEGLNKNSDSVQAQSLADDTQIVNDDSVDMANIDEEFSIEEISIEENNSSVEEVNLEENHFEHAELNSEENGTTQDELNYNLEEDNLDELKNEVNDNPQIELDYEEIVTTQDDFAEDEVDSEDEETSELDELELENPTFLEKETLTDEEKELIRAIKHPVNSNTYIKKEEEYKDLLSAGYTFFIVSIIGLVLLAINALGYINIFSSLLSNIVMGALFIAFLIIGISSFNKANKVKGEVAQENQLTESINNWLLENVTLELLDSFVNVDDNEEIQFMQKLDKMKDMVTEAFGELDELYLDRIVEEFYNNNLEV